MTSLVIEVPIRNDSPLVHSWVTGDKILVVFSLGKGYEICTYTYSKKSFKNGKKSFSQLEKQGALILGWVRIDV